MIPVRENSEVVIKFTQIYGCHQLNSIDPPAFSPGALLPVADRTDLALILILMTLVVLAAWHGDDGEEMWTWQPYGSYWDGTWTQKTSQLNSIWLVVDLPLWKIYEFVSWDDNIPNIWKNHPVMFQSPPTSNSTCFAGNPYGPWRSHVRETVETFQMFQHQVGLLEMTENPALSLHQQVFLLDWNILLQTREISDMDRYGVSINGAPKWLVQNGKSIYKWMI